MFSLGPTTSADVIYTYHMAATVNNLKRCQWYTATGTNKKRCQCGKRKNLIRHTVKALELDKQSRQLVLSNGDYISTALDIYNIQ